MQKVKMSKKVNLIGTILLCAGLLSACTPKQPELVNYAMDCDQIMVELQETRQAIDKMGDTKEVSRSAQTGATVAAHGAAIAGVPYVGPVLAIGTTLFNHGRQTKQIEKQHTQSRLDDLMELAKRRDCGSEYLY